MGYNTGQTTDVAIVGAGVIGCSIAYHLCQAGARVLVLDRAEIAAEASGAAAGLLSPLGNLHGPGAFTDFAMASWSRYPELIPTLEEVSGVQVGYSRPGSLRTASGAEEVEKLRQRVNVWQALGWQISWLTGEEAREREPLLSPDVDAAVHVPQESSILSPNLTRAYAEAARRLGATFIEHTQVTGIQAEHSHVHAVYTAPGGTISCQHLVLAAGAWSASWSEWLGFSIPIAPVRGQMLSLLQPASPLRSILGSNLIYLIPKPDNTIYAAATREHVGFDKRVTAEGIATILSNTLRLAPSLGSASIVNLWAGLRPGSPDGHPLLGKAPGWENVILATGHTSMGFELSAVTGQTIAELITTGQTPELIRPFGIERFTEPGEHVIIY